MKLEPLPRPLEWTVIGTAMTAALVALFSFEFSVPALGVSGFSVALAPRWGLVVLEQVPVDVLWAYYGDEWGNGLTHLRNLVAHDAFFVLSMLSLVSLATRHRVLAKVVPLLSTLGCVVLVGLAAWGERRAAGVPEWVVNRNLSAIALLATMVLWWAYSQRIARKRALEAGLSEQAGSRGTRWF